MPYFTGDWLKDELKKKRAKKGPTVVKPGDVMSEAGDYLVPGETEFPEIEPRTDEATGVRHTPAKLKDIIHQIRGTAQSWMNPSGKLYKSPQAAQFGGPDYLPHTTPPGGASSLSASRMKGALLEREAAAKGAAEMASFEKMDKLLNPEKYDKKKKKKDIPTLESFFESQKDLRATAGLSALDIKKLLEDKEEYEEDYMLGP